ncbi:MAG: hypothetical protein RMK29_19105 [Myxococcales bacterium]|nr:hypothetical protein [Myxococcota bacterium]MDW8283814.1 hypothetical protein [Myxococcales bacterium]
MDRSGTIGLALASLLLLPQGARAIEWWHDPERGCGTLEAWVRTGRIKDLPGCEGELPKGAPPGEIAMRDAKRALHEAEKLLDQGQTAEVETKLEAATHIMNRAPNDPRVNWARPHYAKALGILRARLAIVPRLPTLRQAYKAALEAASQAARLRTEEARRDALAKADACVQAFRDAEGQGVDLSIPVELTPGKPRPLREDLRDCATGQTATASSEPVAAARPEATASTDRPTASPQGPVQSGGSDGGVPRDKWIKALRGDRKKVFLAHPDAFPEYEGAPGPKGAAKAAEWRYGSEVFLFKGNRLVKPKDKKKKKK